MKIYVLNVWDNHSCIDILSKFGVTSRVQEWPPVSIELKSNEPVMLFAKLDNEEDLLRISKSCELRGDFCFIWASNSTLTTSPYFASPSLVDFVIDGFDDYELSIRLTRLVRLQRLESENKILSVPDEIASELTKKQLVMLNALFEADQSGLTKEELTERIWKNNDKEDSRANGFNVHLLHLRRKLEEFGLEILYNKKSRLYRLKSIKKMRKSLVRKNPLKVINH